MVSTPNQSQNGLHHQLPTVGIGGKLPSSFVKSGIDRLMEQDINPQYNLGSFVTTGLDSVGERLLLENYPKNLACHHEYSGVKEIHDRCVSILGALWEASSEGPPVGSATSGSSEAIYLGLLAMKRIWEAGTATTAAPRPVNPNIIVGSHVHVAVTNGASANDIEVRTVGVTSESNYSFDPTKMEDLIDENTIGVVLVLGNTYTGHFDPVEEVSNTLDKYEQSTGQSIPIHVDAASGGFVAPFNGKRAPRWNFSIPRVVSINASGHKFGLAAAAVGWIVWRSDAFLPLSLVHHSAYLSGQNALPTIRFSQAAYGVLLQYYYLAHLGQQGFEDMVHDSCQRAADLSRTLEETGVFVCVSEIHQRTSGALPLVAFCVRPVVQNRYPSLDENWISSKLMESGYSVPCCRLPIRDEEINILRVVLRPGLKQSTLNSFIARLLRLVEQEVPRFKAIIRSSHL